MMIGILILGALLAMAQGSTSYFWLLAWPGTVVHEICHYVVGLFMLGRPYDVKIFPEAPKNGEQVLGSVNFLNIGWWNALPIGVAPLLGGVLALVIADRMNFDWSWGSAFWVFVLASVVSQCWPSSEDWRIAFKHPFGVIIYGAMLYMIVTK